MAIPCLNSPRRDNNLYHLVEVIGITSNYTVGRKRANDLLESGRAFRVDKGTIQMIGNRKKHSAREWVKTRSGGAPVMQLVETRKLRPRNKPNYLK